MRVFHSESTNYETNFQTWNDEKKVCFLLKTVITLLLYL